MEAAAREPVAAGNGDLAVSADDSSLYEDMKFVRRHPRAFDKTEGQRDARRWKQRDIRSFLSKLADLEKTAMERQGEPGQTDESEEACIKLTEKLLAERFQHSRGE
jgi:hypothetical protein